MKLLSVDSKKICVQLGLKEGLNRIEEVQDGQKENTIEVGKRFYEFSRDENIDDTEFLGFNLSPDFPCHNQQLSPMKKSELNYPFNSKPNVGCGFLGSTSYRNKELLSMNQNELLRENSVNENTTGLPFFKRYFSEQDELKLFIQRKHYLDASDEC